MSPWRSIFAVFVALVLSVSLAVPAEDVPETAYDESESLPCESAPVVSIAVAKIYLEAPTVRPRASLVRLGSLRRSRAQHLERVAGGAYPISDSLTILEHSLRC